MASIKVDITPAVMEWCRKTAGYSIEIAAKKLDRPEADIIGWENGTIQPTLVQLRKTSEVYKQALAVFFLPEPPKGFSTLRDFRTLPDGYSEELSPELNFLISDTRMRQEWTREYLIEEGVEALPFIGKKNMDSNSREVAKDICDTFSVTLDEQKACRSREEFLKLWLSRVEEAGVFVFRKAKINLTESRGFVLCDNYAPFIFVNSGDAKAGQLFTLIHELAHLWINESGISNLEFIDSRSIRQETRIETFCNKVAAEVLVDTEVFLKLFNAHSRSIEIAQRIEILSNEFNVSEEVIARKLLETGNVSLEKYKELRNKYQKRWNKHNKEAPRHEGTPSYYRLKIFNLGYAFTRVVLSAYSHGSISGCDTSMLLGVKLNNLGKLSELARPLFSVGG